MATKVLLRMAYDDHEAYSRGCVLECKDETLAQQHQKEESDINVIVRRFGVSGQLPQGVRAPTYGDFSEVMDYKSAQLAIIAADKAFMAMPADVRARFGNDPQLFVEFCSDKSNLDEMRKMGLANPAPVDDAGGGDSAAGNT